MSEQNVEIVRSAYEALNRGDMVAWRNLVDPAVEFVDHNPTPDASGRLYGRDALEQYLARFQGEFDAFRAEVMEFTPLGDRVVCAVIWRGTGKGSSAAVEWHGAELVTVRDGQIVRGESGFPSKEAALKAAGLAE
jgi:ketosteroid isomerase-like protein